MVTTETEYTERTNKIREVILNLLFEVKKPIVTEVTIKKQVNCYNINIQRVVRDINLLKVYPYISCINNSYGVLSLVV